MLFAIIGNISGNARTLARVLDAIADDGIETVLHSGNVLLGPQPNEAVELLQHRRVICVEGEFDKLVVTYRRKRQQLARFYSAEIIEQAAKSYDALRSANLEFVDALPRVRKLEIDHIRIVLSHGLPGKANERLTQRTAFARLQREREDQEADAIICGGGSAFFAVQADPAWFINPGEMDGDLGSYVTVNTETEPWRIEVSPTK